MVGDLQVLKWATESWEIIFFKQKRHIIGQSLKNDQCGSFEENGLQRDGQNEGR